MELSKNSELEAGRLKCLGRCRHFFWLGVAFDTVGATVLLVGIFSDLLFYDLLLYLGSIIIFLSLLWWVFWYAGNIELSPEDAWKRPMRMATMSQHMSVTVDITSTLARGQRGQRRRRLLRSTASLLSRTLTGQVLKQQAKEDQGGVTTSVQNSSETEDVGGQVLGPEPEAVKRSGGASPRGPEAGRPSGRLVLPKFTPAVLNLALPSAVVSSRSVPQVPSSSASHSVMVCYSKSMPTSMASMIQPLATVDAADLPGVPLPSTSQPLDARAPDTQASASVVSQSRLLVHVAAQSHFQVTVDSERDLENNSVASQTEPPSVQAFQIQAVASQVMPDPFFQAEPVDPQVSLAIQDLQALYHTQQAPLSTTLVQEIEPSQSSQAQESSGGQELSQEVPDTVFPAPESLAAATEAQQSMPHESEPGPTTQNSRHV